MSNTTIFGFMPAEVDDIIKETNNLYDKKNGTLKIIPTRLLKDVFDI